VDLNATVVDIELIIVHPCSLS